MIQAFYTASSGMHVQQRNIDVISENITNISTPGYRVKRAEFKEILLAQSQNQQTQSKVQVGHGVKISNITTMALPDDVNPFGMTMDEKGYFVVEDANGNRSYTKNGDFKLLNENNKYYLTTKTNEYVLDTDGNRVELDPDPEKLVLFNNQVFANGNNGEPGVTLAAVKFETPAALGRKDSENFIETAQSGIPQQLNTPNITYNYFDKLAPLASTNQMNEMTRLVQTQMAYQISSKALQAADEMEGMSNHLRY